MDQQEFSYIESSEVFLSFGRILFSQHCLVLKLDEKMQQLLTVLQFSSKTNASRMLPRRFVDHKMKQGHVPK